MSKLLFLRHQLPDMYILCQCFGSNLQSMQYRLSRKHKCKCSFLRILPSLLRHLPINIPLRCKRLHGWIYLGQFNPELHLRYRQSIPHQHHSHSRQLLAVFLILLHQLQFFDHLPGLRYRLFRQFS